MTLQIWIIQLRPFCMEVSFYLTRYVSDNVLKADANDFSADIREFRHVDYL